MGIGPAPAARMAMEKAGLTLEDMDIVGGQRGFRPAVQVRGEGARPGF